ncbi:MAG: hypothetical protein AB1796_15410 [Bacillota bacterium]
MVKKEDSVQRYLEEGLVALLPACGVEPGGTHVLTLGGTYHDPRSLSWLVELLARFYSLDLAAVRRHSGRLLGLRHHIPLPLANGLVLLPVKVRQATALEEGTAGYVNLLQVKDVAPLKTRTAVAVGANTATGTHAAAVAGTDTAVAPDTVADTVAFYASAASNDGKPASAAKSTTPAAPAAPTAQSRPLPGQGRAAASVPGTGMGIPGYFQAGDPASSRSRITCGGGLVIFCLNTAATVNDKLRQGETVRRELLQRQKITTVPAAPFSGLDGAALRELLPSCRCFLRSLFLWVLDSTTPQEVER